MADPQRKRARFQWRRLAWRERLHAGLIGLSLLGVIALARGLTPDPRGLGTHEQLGFPPCLAARFLHVPCPLCGMTTAFAWMAHGEPVRSIRTQPAGAFAFVATLAAAAACLLGLLVGRAAPFATAPRCARWGFRAGCLALGVAWMYKIVTFM